MKDLSMHVLDITENSVQAGASDVDVELHYKEDVLELTIRDNGRGMDSEMVKRVTDAYTTSRTKRKVGLGLPFLKMNAEQSGGSVVVKSRPGEGTVVKAVFVTSHIDCIPAGDLPSSLSLLITGHPDVNFRIKIIRNDEVFEISSAEIQEILDGIPISHPKVGVFIKKLLREEM